MDAKAGSGNNKIVLQAALLCVSLSLWYATHIVSHHQQQQQLAAPAPIPNNDETSGQQRQQQSEVVAADEKQKVLILYSTVTGTAKSMAHRLSNFIVAGKDGGVVSAKSSRGKKMVSASTSSIPITANEADIRVLNVAEYDVDDSLSNESIVIFLCSTCAEGTPPPTGAYFLSWLQDMAVDFRINKDHFKKIRYAGFGLGGLVYGNKHFCTPIKTYAECMAELGAQPLVTASAAIGTGDDQSDLEEAFQQWSSDIATNVRESIQARMSATTVQQKLNDNLLNSETAGASAATRSDSSSSVWSLVTSIGSWFHGGSTATKAKNSSATSVSELSLEQVKALPYSRKNKKLIKALEKQEKEKDNGGSAPVSATGADPTAATASSISGVDVADAETASIASSNPNTNHKLKRPKFQVVMRDKKAAAARRLNRQMEQEGTAAAAADTDGDASSEARKGSSCCGGGGGGSGGSCCNDTAASAGAAAGSSSNCCNENNSSSKSKQRRGKSSCCGGGATPVAATVGDEDEECEEDRINNAYITMDLLPPESDDEEQDCCGGGGIESEDDDEDDDEFGSGNASGTDYGSADDSGSESDSDEASSKKNNSKGAAAVDKGIVDLEDLGGAIAASGAIDVGVAETATANKTKTKSKTTKRSTRAPKESAATNTGTASSTQPKRANEMVTTLQRKALTKEGYKIIGTHSAVKMCRWTKNQMRGRGGCYKHSFYGITSYQCMEATPSLACANKCVFCWRHHKNPVGTEWRWKTDEPSMIVEQAVGLHQAMVNEMRGVPGLVPERLQEAFTVRHCALSLVGEPIMYPRINEMCRELHERKISTFLVTNGQFPEMISALQPVTQLYVSIDAASKSSLKAIDRPLFKDYWERYLSSLKHLSRKSQRTVYRMTLVKSWNMDEAEQYAELIEYGCPDFIEIKSVTYCGKSDASSLTMENVPWHVEVCNYAEAIVAQLNRRRNIAINSGQGARISPAVYGIATEHEHSCCILIAREDKFKLNGHWHTWIDYDKFDDLVAQYYTQVDGMDVEEGKEIEVLNHRYGVPATADRTTAASANPEYSTELRQITNKFDTLRLAAHHSFAATDYMRKTPSWALYKSTERGFDPDESRFRRNKAGVLVPNDYRPTDSGCG